MSRSSIKPSTSPTIDDTRDDELAAGADHGSYHEAFRGSESKEQIKQDDSGHAGYRSSRTLKDYPIDADLFYSTPAEPALHQDEVAEEIEYEEPPTEELVHPPDFKPFFTLLEDPETGEYVHPTVHYIFTDDDPEILTSAVLDTLDQNEESTNRQKSLDGVEERYVIVDIAADGKNVVSASSLSPDWQALQTSITQAPSWGEEGQNAERGLMLKVSGRSKRAGRKQEYTATGDIEDLVRSYGERLDRLDEMMGGRG